MFILNIGFILEMHCCETGPTKHRKRLQWNKQRWTYVYDIDAINTAKEYKERNYGDLQWFGLGKELRLGQGLGLELEFGGKKEY